MKENAVITGQQLWEWSQKAKAEAIAADIPPREVDGLLQEWVGLDRLTLRLGSFKDQPEINLRLPWREFMQLWERRVKERVPLQYLTGVAGWRHFGLTVSPAVLIPRPETELIVDLVVGLIQRQSQICDQNLQLGHWVDLGTGSGAIALGLASVLTEASIHAVDCSREALAIAQKNAQDLGFADRIAFYQGRWWEPLDCLRGKVSGMVSNPPYIPTAMLSTLQPEVARHEPHLALDGGESGLDCIQHLVQTAPAYLHSGGVWLVEMMAGQGEQVVELLKDQGCYTQIEQIRDLAGIERFVLARYQ
ncbi:peptide chain release factor N(5)-glutamine methyltransferase [Lyngbya sp. PCC 8106]|uniref:peptide chain release factor N(5)-glutamine methyltransferase n=1 Tax=Lyngbya sp. (strain PCC 8106) TaxID=313612 RepID=UPI0000EA9BFF|nr:peptide chain release factor N(5)-glutamine methyltransferase [Lyngbya sp. PCC 8106]EAW37406.1 Modification methylase HemK [Lyngbya sp. PCC 8106]